MVTEEQEKLFENRWLIREPYLKSAMELMLIEHRVDFVKKLCRYFYELGMNNKEDKQ